MEREEWGPAETQSLEPGNFSEHKPNTMSRNWRQESFLILWTIVYTVGKERGTFLLFFFAIEQRNILAKRRHSWTERNNNKQTRTPWGLNQQSIHILSLILVQKKDRQKKIKKQTGTRVTEWKGGNYLEGETSARPQLITTTSSTQMHYFVLEINCESDINILSTA